MATAFPVACLASFLRGSWGLRRSISDFRGGAQHTVVGEARWHDEEPAAADADVDTAASPPQLLRYEEAGRLDAPPPASPVATRQAQLWRLGPVPSAARVAHGDGRFFHALDLASGRHERIVHACAPDEYVGRVEALSRDALRIEWRVRGPAKDYLSVTVFERRLSKR